ncbi:hypothetical protein EMPS_08236 [Entomortierella parvispora]|uniref:Uncharacterized protein n=1 Tax=Entomortierella parvispora TaxID=205924 RepID=A0A9P3LZ75_9FUNG|nr:hypothetical protein EMPS_08236 [Entomortierella parvispora]
MDQGTPSNFYLTICLYVSFYFLFFTTASPQLIPTDQELHESRRAQSYSEQLDPFLAATRQAQATKQVKDLAKARAKQTVGTVRSYHHKRHSTSTSRRSDSTSTSSPTPYSTTASPVHSRQHSRNLSTSGAKSSPRSQQQQQQQQRHGNNHSRPQHTGINTFLREFSLHKVEKLQDNSQLQEEPVLSTLPGAFKFSFPDPPSFNPSVATSTGNTEAPSSNSSNTSTGSNSHNPHGLNFQLLQHQQAREQTRPFHQQQQFHQDSSQPLSSHSPHIQFQDQGSSSAAPPPVLIPSAFFKFSPQRQPPRRFPRQNQNRYYHFYPETPLFRKKPSINSVNNSSTDITTAALHHPHPHHHILPPTSITSRSASKPAAPFGHGMISPSSAATATTTTTSTSPAGSSPSQGSVSTAVAAESQTIPPSPPVVKKVSIAAARQINDQHSHSKPQPQGQSQGQQGLQQNSGQEEEEAQARTLSIEDQAQSQSQQKQTQLLQQHQARGNSNVNNNNDNHNSTTTPPLPLSQTAPRSHRGTIHTLNHTTTGTRTRYEAKVHLEDSVTPATLLAHLRLLRLVQSLVIVEDEDLDFLFLIRSEERYLLYMDMLQQRQPLPASVPLPPLDVALMWTVHMLAPFRYHEDLLRSYGPHLLNYYFPLERYVAAVDIENPSTEHEDFLDSKAMWQQQYPGEPFDLDKEDTTRMFDIQCLWCGGTNVMDSSTYIKFRIDGMSIDCAGCESQCSLETLSSKRLWDGIEAYRADSSYLLAGSLLSPWTGSPDPIAAQREHHHLFFHPRIQFGLDQASVSLNCTWPKVIQAFQDLGPDQYYGIRPTTLARIMSSYMSLIDDRLSMDLVAGALRQRDFQKAMMVTGGQAWCQPQVLQRSLDRYKKFMLLARAESKHSSSTATTTVGSGIGGAGVAGGGSNSSGIGGGGIGNVGGLPGRHSLVPTLDIDLAWHTHMLSPAHYRQYQQFHYGRVLNHDDTVQATSLMTKQDFVRTAELWQELYQERYSSQELAWVGLFVLTPEKLCVGVVFPPYGIYLIWKSLKAKKKARRLLKAEKKRQKQSLSSRASREAEIVAAASSMRLNEKQQPQEHLQQQELMAEGVGPSQAIADSQAEPSEKSGLEISEETSTQAAVPDAKGKGRMDENASFDEKSATGSENSTAKEPTDSLHRNLTPALGLDGRFSNWNDEALGPDGQASCSSGACIMSPWNELQDFSPYAEIQYQHQQHQQQQRELRKERSSGP